MLVLKRRPKQCIWIDKKVYIEIAHVRGSEVEVHIDFPREYEVLRGELVDLDPPEPKRQLRKQTLAKALKAFALTAFFFFPQQSLSQSNDITINARTLMCETPLDYYGAFDSISKGKISVDGSFPQARHNCLWTDKAYRATVIMVAPPFYLAEISIINPSDSLSLVRGWVGLSEVENGPDTKNRLP